jgi:hypothetical protein
MKVIPAHANTDLPASGSANSQLTFVLEFRSGLSALRR